MFGVDLELSRLHRPRDARHPSVEGASPTHYRLTARDFYGDQLGRDSRDGTGTRGLQIVSGQGIGRMTQHAGGGDHTGHPDARGGRPNRNAASSRSSRPRTMPATRTSYGALRNPAANVATSSIRRTSRYSASTFAPSRQ